MVPPFRAALLGGLRFARFFGAFHEIGELAKMLQAVAFAAGRRTDGCGQHVNMRAVEKLFLDSVIAFALGELLEGELAVEGDYARKILLEFSGKHEAAFSKILALQFFDGFRRALDEISEADAEFDNAAVVRIVEGFGDDAAVIEQGPERIAAAGVIVAGPDGRLRGIATHDHELHSFA